MPTDSLSMHISNHYGPRPQSRSMAETVVEVHQLCQRVAALVVAADGGDAPAEADVYRKQAIGALWGAGIHYRHAEEWVDEAVSHATFDFLPLP